MHSKRLALFLRKLYKKYGDLMSLYLSFYYKRWCKDIMRRNGFVNKKQSGEDEYIRKWKALSKNVNPAFYRIFSNYIEPNSNIVPEDISHNIIEHILNPTKHRPYYDDKNMFDKILPRSFMPITLLRNINGSYLDAVYNYVKIEHENELSGYFNNHEGIIIKPATDSSSGRNIDLFLKQCDGNFKHATNDQLLNLDYLSNKFKQNFIIQEQIKQHEYIAQFNPTSVNTLRLLTYKSVKTDESAVTSAVMRIGGKGSYVDNAHAGGVYIGINRDGVLGDFAADQYGKKYFKFNEIDFTSNKYQIPHFQKALNFAKEVAKNVIHHRILAMDIVITENGTPKIIEYNIGSLSTWLFQFTISSAFEEYTDEIMEYCKTHKHEIERVRVSVW